MPDNLFTPPAITASAEDLSALAGEFKALDHEVEVGLRQNIDKMMKLGRIVLKFKAGCLPRTFQAEFKKRCPTKMRSAYRYLRMLSKRKDVQEADNLGDALKPYADDLDVPEEEGDPEAETGEEFCATVAQNSQKSAPANDLDKSTKNAPTPAKASAPASPPPPETPAERVRRHVSALLDKLAEVNMDMEDIIRTPLGLPALEVAEQLKVEVTQEFHGEEDRFGRASDTKGERHYFPKPVKELVQWWTTYLRQLENPNEVDF